MFLMVFSLVYSSTAGASWTLLISILPCFNPFFLYPFLYFPTSFLYFLSFLYLSPSIFSFFKHVSPGAFPFSCSRWDTELLTNVVSGSLLQWRLWCSSVRFLSSSSESHCKVHEFEVSKSILRFVKLFDHCSPFHPIFNISWLRFLYRCCVLLLYSLCSQIHAKFLCFALSSGKRTSLFDNCSSFHSIFISHDFVFYTDAVFYFKIHFVYKFMQSSCVSRVPEKGNVKETP